MKTEKQVINAPSWAEHISDKDPVTEQKWMEKVPSNCVFNKGITGCGATTLAITQPGHTILAMPYCGLVDNKVASNPNLLGVHGETKWKSDIGKYLKTHEQIKIAATYDSVPLVIDTLISQGYDPYQDFFLFVDEWHILFNSYNFRKQAAKRLLERAAHFDSKTYVSATPVPREYWLTELTDLPEIGLVWPNAVKPNLNSIKYADPLGYMAMLCKSRVRTGGEDHYHVFINSVEGIMKIIRLAGLNPTQCRIVCSQSENSKDKNQKKLGEFKIQKTTDPVKLFNFYTSTCFEGQDIFDPVGRIFIVSEEYKDHTKMDVMTTLPQICGRIRDSRYNAEITQIYATSIYKDVTREEFAATIKKKVEEAEHDAELFNRMAPDRKKRLINRYICTEPYMGEVDGDIVVDHNLANLELMNYDIINGQYASPINMNASLAQAGFQVTNNTQAVDEQLETITSIEKTPFKQIFEEYANIRSNDGMYNLGILRASRIEIEKPLVKEAYDVLGPAKVREMNYHQSNIKKEIIKCKDETLFTKAFLLLDRQLPKQVAIPKTVIKQKLSEVYKELGIQGKASASDLEKWYDLKSTTKRGNDGATQSCFCIISPKIKASR